MPPKFKFTKDEIVNAAVNVTRRIGLNYLTSRDIAKELGVSTQPVFTCFSNMNEAKKEVCLATEKIFDEHVLKGLNDYVPFFGFGKAYIDFAKTEPKLYELLFLSPANEYSKGAISAMKNIQDAIRPSLVKIYKLTDEQADRYFRDLWLVVHAVCTLIVTNCCPYSDEEISAILSGFSLSVCKSIKEIEGFVENTYDKNALFSELVKK